MDGLKTHPLCCGEERLEGVVGLSPGWLGAREPEVILLLLESGGQQSGGVVLLAAQLVNGNAWKKKYFHLDGLIEESWKSLSSRLIDGCVRGQTI